MRGVAIVGLGMTKIKAHWDKSMRDLFAEAALKAIDDSGNLEPQVLYVSSMLSGELSGQSALGPYVAEYCGLRDIPAIRIEGACSSGGVALHEAIQAVSSGAYDTVLVGGVEKLTEYPTSIVTSALAEASEQEYEAYFGATFVSLNALLMRYYMNKYGVKYEDMAEWPVLMHENGSVNPYAQLPFKTTIERVISSPLIADPIRLFDCAPTGVGASALLVTTYDNAKKVTDTPVRIVGYGVGTDFISISLRERLDLLRASINASNKAYKMARVKPEDVDVAEIHDAFTIMAILSIEDLGFSKKGEGVRELKEGRFRKGDKPSINPSGGLKSRGHPVGATGIYQAAEVAMQLRGDAGPIQVDGVEVGLTQNIGGAGTSITVFIYKL